MRKIVLQVMFLGLPLFGFSQVGGSVVYDPTQATNMATQIKNTSTQISQLDKSLELMKKASDKLEKVNGALRDIEELAEIKSLYELTMKYANMIRKDVGKVKSKRRREIIIRKVTNSIGVVQNSLSFVNKVLSSNFFSMSDKDRIDLLAQEKSKILGQKAELLSLMYGF